MKTTGTIEKLARMTKVGFDEVTIKLDQMATGIYSLVQGQEIMQSKLDHCASKVDIIHLDQRLTRVEHHLGFDSAR